MVATMNYLSALVGEVASSKAVKGQGDVPEVKVHHPPSTQPGPPPGFDSEGWTTVQSGRKQKGGNNTAQAGAKLAGKNVRQPASKSARKNRGGQNAAQAGAKPSSKPSSKPVSVPSSKPVSVPSCKPHSVVTLGDFWKKNGADNCHWKKPAVAEVVTETSRPTQQTQRGKKSAPRPKKSTFATRNSFEALEGEVASSKAVKGQGDVPEVKVKVHHPPSTQPGPPPGFDREGWTTVQSGRKQKGGNNTAQAGAKPAGKNAGQPVGKNADQPAGQPAGKNAGKPASEPACKPRSVATLGDFWKSGADNCPWKKPAVAATATNNRKKKKNRSPSGLAPIAKGKAVVEDLACSTPVVQAATASPLKRKKKMGRQ